MLPPIERLETLSPEEVTRILLREREGQWYDRKSARIKAAKLAESIVAMANTEGGVLAIGLSEGVCEGVDHVPGAQNEWRQAGLDRVRPPVRTDVTLLDCINHAGQPDHLFLLNVRPIRPSEQLHTTTADAVFQRVGDANHRLSFEQRIELRYDRGDTTFELTPIREARHADLDQDRIAEYARRIGHPDPQRLLQARDLVDADGTPLVAGVLLFGADPQRAFPAAWVRVLRYTGSERLTGTNQNLVSDIRCEGTLPQQIDAAREALREVLPRRKALGPEGRFGWFDLVPESAWQEAVVNAVLHRAYSNFGDHIRVSVFDDRIEVSSPGRFPGVSRPGDLTHVRRFARNPRIARVMAELEYGEELGEGLRRMVEVMESRGQRRPVLRETAGGVEIALYGPWNPPPALAEMTPLAQFLFERIRSAGRLTTRDLAEMAERSPPTVRKHLHLLEAGGLVRWTGTSRRDPRGAWSLGGEEQ